MSTSRRARRFSARCLKNQVSRSGSKNWPRSSTAPGIPHFPPRPFHVYKLFFVCTILGGAPRTSLETTEIGFFTEENLPADISIGRVVPYQIGRMFEHYRAPELPTEFD